MEATQAPTTVRDLYRLQESQEEAWRWAAWKLLESRGWTETCIDTPGALWLWHKQLEDGRNLLVDMGTALAFEGEADPEEEEDDE